MDRLKARFPIYSRLLCIYPIDYQRKYGEQMLQMLADMLDDPERTKTSVWLRTALDFPVSVGKQQLIYTGAAMTHDTPKYMKRNALLGATLLLMLPAAIVVSQFVRGAVLPTSDWATVFLVTFVGLPAIAFLIGAATFLYWVADQRRKTGSSFWKSLADIRRNWPLLLVTGLGLILALFIPFHDSTHCVMGNPIHEAIHLNQTWRCIQQSR